MISGVKTVFHTVRDILIKERPRLLQGQED